MSLIDSRLLAYRSVSSEFYKNEIKGSRNGAREVFENQSADPMGIMTPEMRQKGLQAINTPLNFPVFDYKSATIASTTQPVTVTDDRLSSALYTVVWIDYYFGFLVYPGEFANNEFNMQQYFNQQMRRFDNQLAIEQDQDALAALETYKSQVLNDDLGGRYSLSSNVVVAPVAEQDAVVGDINPLMHGNDFYGPFDVVANPSLESFVRNNLMEKGNFNTENKTYQYADKNWFFTNELANGSGHKATGIAIEKGTLGTLEQFAPDCLMGHRSSDGHEWGITTLPISGERMGTYFYSGAANGASISGAASSHLTATLVQAFGFHKKKAYIVAYNSDLSTLANPIMKFAIATS